ncbi:MAG TPA: Uma2 family endonuclease [Pyrinomonadaceae bacterium]|nr:Uma2 family endonuclease [Pyrinomonadaceae bacterium]
MTTTALGAPEQRVVLTGVSWATYERLLHDLKDSSSPRLTFDRGVLEVMSPSAEHEESNRTISLLVEVLAEEFGLDVRNLGSTTFRREDLEQGFEPDSCFYVQNEGRMRGKREIDLTADPPPDLIIEVDITSPSLNKFPIYAALGVPEIWRYDGRAATIFRLEGGGYVEAGESAALPRLTSGDLSRFVAEGTTAGRREWLRGVREWARGR